MKIDLKNLSNKKLKYLIDFNLEYGPWIAIMYKTGYKTKEKVMKYINFCNQLQAELKQRNDQQKNIQLEIIFE